MEAIGGTGPRSGGEFIGWRAQLPTRQHSGSSRFARHSLPSWWILGVDGVPSGSWGVVVLNEGEDYERK